MSSNKVWDISRALLLLHNPPIHLMPEEGTARSSPLFKRNGPLQIMQIVKQIKAIFQIFLWFLSKICWYPTGPRICRAKKLQQLESVSTSTVLSFFRSEHLSGKIL